MKQVKFIFGKSSVCVYVLFLSVIMLSSCSKDDEVINNKNATDNEEIVTKSTFDRPGYHDRVVYLRVVNKSSHSSLALQFSSWKEHCDTYRYYGGGGPKDFSGGMFGNPTEYKYLVNAPTCEIFLDFDGHKTIPANFYFFGSRYYSWRQEILLAFDEDDQIRLNLGSSKVADHGDSYGDVVWEKEGTPIKVDVKIDELWVRDLSNLDDWAVYYTLTVTNK